MYCIEDDYDISSTKSDDAVDENEEKREVGCFVLKMMMISVVPRVMMLLMKMKKKER